MTRETVGKIATDLMSKSPELRPVKEMGKAMTEDYINNLIICANENIKNYPNKSFFIMVLTKNERLLPNVFRNYFYARSTCPTPEYDQTVFRFDHKKEQINYIWTVPSRDTCEYFLKNTEYIPESERTLLNFIWQFETKELLKLSKELNGEELETALLSN